MFFDASDDKVVGTHAFSGAPAITILAWVRRFGVATYCNLVLVGTEVGDQAYILGYNTNGKMLAGGIYGSGCVTTSKLLSDVAWHRIGLRCAGGASVKANITFDGAQVAEGAARTPNITGTTVSIGKTSGSAAGSAWMFDVRIYGRAISDAELLADARGEWISDTGLVRHWPFEVISGGKTPERIGATQDTVTGAIIDSLNKPFSARATSPARATS